MNPNNIQQNLNSELTGATGEKAPTFRGPEYYRNLNTALATPGNQGVPPTIPLNVATGSVEQVKLPGTPSSGTATQLSTQAGGYLAQPTVTNLNQLGESATVAGQNLQKASGEYQTQVGGLIDQMKNRPGELEKEYNIQGLSADAMKAKANYDSVELGYRREKEALMANGALSAEQKQASLREIERKEASQKADIAIDYNLKAGLLSNAKELMDKQIALELEPMKMKVDFYKTMKEDYKDIFNQAQNRQLDYLAKKEERAYQQAKDEKERIQSLQMQAIKDGIPWDKVSSIKSISDYAKLTGQKPEDVIAETNAKNNIENIQNAINNKGGLAGSVGLREIGRRQMFRLGKVQSFIGALDQITGQLTIDKLLQAKASGATFGALSDSEQRLVATSATKLNSWALKDKEGKVVGYNASEDDVKKELKTIKDMAVLDYEKRTGKKWVEPQEEAKKQLDEMIGGQNSAVSPQYVPTLETIWSSTQSTNTP